MKKWFIYIVMLLTIFHFSTPGVQASERISSKGQTPKIVEEDIESIGEHNDYEESKEATEEDNKSTVEMEAEFIETSSKEDDGLSKEFETESIQSQSNQEKIDELSDGAVEVKPSTEQEDHPLDSAERQEEFELKEKLKSNEETESLDEKSADNLVEDKEKVESKSVKMNALSTNIELPYKQGDNHEKIIAIQVKLNALSFGGIAETGNYGSWTAKRVKEFQAYYGLSETGEVNQLTLDKLNDVYSSPYQKGKRNSYTAEIKKMLNVLGYDGLADGPAFGSLTETRLKQFQRDNGLKAHGIADERTISMLEKAYKKSDFQVDDNHPAVILIKQKLNALGFDGLAETGNYGSWTATRVKQFQAYYGLPETGIADGVTQQKLNDVYNSPYQKGKRNSYTAEIKKMLNVLGYDGLADGPVFGGLTETRVKQFQRDNGLKAHGIADERTISMLEKAYNKSAFQVGDNHPAVIAIKQKLNALGFDGLAETGNYGSWTATRVKQFQAYYGLSETGIADEKTQQKLNDVYNSPYQKGKSNSYTAEIKKMLNVLGYDGLADGPVFGGLTETRLKQFQRDNGLKAHGIADKYTIKKLETKLNNSNILKKGDRKPGVIDLKRKLNKLGYDGLALTNNFGSLTETRLKQFQRDYGLKEYGMADKLTLKKIDDILANSLIRGDRKPQVIELKRNLNSLGYNGLALTNNFGSLTETRLKQFQRDNNLPANGIADAKTLQVIENSFVKIFIDPGHGDQDPGGTGYGLKEKDIVLDIGLRIAEELSGYVGVKVMLSRTKDTFLELSERTNMANNWVADYFVSLHTNAAGGTGFETFIYNGSVSQETKNRQKDIHTYLANWLKSNNGINDRGMKRANFHVVRESTMPSILLEYMFIDNAKENNLLKSKSYLNSLGKVTAQAIANSFNLKKK